MNRFFSLILLLILSNPVAAKLSVGDAGPLRLGKDVKSAEEVLLPDSAGKIAVVHFWASWCDYCLKTLPAMEFMQEQLGLSQLQVVSVAVKDEPKTVKKLTAELNELQMLLTVDKTGKVAESFGDDYLPNVWIIGRNGKVLAQMQLKNDDDLIKAVKFVETAIKAK